MKVKLISGIIELPHPDKYLRQFIVKNDSGRFQVHVWSNDKNKNIFKVGVHPQDSKRAKFHRNCTALTVKLILKTPQHYVKPEIKRVKIRKKK